jgi:hypothetical protein
MIPNHLKKHKSNTHYLEYRHVRLELKPERNLPNQIHEPITQTVVDVNWHTSEEDSELNEFRYKTARINSLIAALKEKKALYNLLTYHPIVSRKMKGTFPPSKGYGAAAISWEQRKKEAVERWNHFKEQPDKVGYYSDELNQEKEKARKEFRYMTSGGQGFQSYLVSLAQRVALEIQEEVLGELGTFSMIIDKKESSKLAKKQAIGSIIHTLNKSVSSERKWFRKSENHRQYCRDITTYDGEDPTSLIGELRSRNKELKDIEKDLIDFGAAFAEPAEEDAVMLRFDSPLNDIPVRNPYHDKRVFWEMKLDNLRETGALIDNRIAQLQRELIKLGHEEDFKLIQEKRDIKFRSRYERKNEIKRNQEDRKEQKTDKEEASAADSIVAEIKSTRKGHGHKTSTGKEKYLYLSEDEAYKALVAQYSKSGRKLEVYKKNITVSFTKWNKDRRYREDWESNIAGWFLRKFRA